MENARESTEETSPRGMLALVEQTPFRKLTVFLDGMAAIGAVRKTSKSVSSHWLLDIYEARDARTLVLAATLYFEHFIERRLRRNNLQRNRRALAKEIKTLVEVHQADEDLADNMLVVVDLRNEFVHNLYYDIADWNPLSAPFLSVEIPRMPKPRHLRELKNLVLLKILLVEIFQRLHRLFPWLNLEDVPRQFRGRSNNSLNPAASLRSLRLATG